SGTGASFGGTPTGTVTFSEGTTVLGTAPVALDSSGNYVATLLTSTLSAGTHQLTAAYSGDANYGASTSAALSLTINAAPSVSLGSLQSTAVYGQPVTFPTAVTAAGGGIGTPSVSVTFLDGTTVLGQATLDSTGSASFTIATLGVGTHSITVSYGAR